MNQTKQMNATSHTQSQVSHSLRSFTTSFESNTGFRFCITGLLLSYYRWGWIVGGRELKCQNGHVFLNQHRHVTSTKNHRLESKFKSKSQNFNLQLWKTTHAYKGYKRLSSSKE